jgi:hypothetical protein
VYRAAVWLAAAVTDFARNLSPISAYERSTLRRRRAARTMMQTDRARSTAKAIDTQTGEVRQARAFVAVLMTG